MNNQQIINFLYRLLETQEISEDIYSECAEAVERSESVVPILVEAGYDI